MAKAVFDPKAANIWTARIIPVILIGLVGYVTWVFISLLCVDYLLRPLPHQHAARSGTATALIVIYCVFLLLVALTYLRLLYIVNTHPGYVPRGPRWYANKERQRKSRSRSRIKTGKREPTEAIEKANGIPVAGNGYTKENGNYTYADGPPIDESNLPEEEASNLRSFYTKDAFTCEGDGRPAWCSTCLNFKPDRAHHCREVGRCVRKMDHFCPWVGGVISETSFKFFVQFVFWAGFYWVFNLIVMAIFVAELKKQTTELNIHWIVVLACGALFGLFTLGMTMSSMQFVLLNTTTIENLSRHSKVWSLAIFMPSSANYATPLPFNTITYPLGYMYPNQDDSVPVSSSLRTSPRIFAILHSKPGENVWDLGYWRNFTSVMGETWYDWLLPIKYSPCCNHNRFGSQFEMGHVAHRLREDAGIHLPYDVGKPEHRTRNKRRRRRTTSMDESGARRSRRKGRRQKEVEMTDIDGEDATVR